MVAGWKPGGKARHSTKLDDLSAQGHQIVFGRQNSSRQALGLPNGRPNKGVKLTSRAQGFVLQAICAAQLAAYAQAVRQHHSEVS